MKGIFKRLIVDFQERPVHERIHFDIKTSTIELLQGGNGYVLGPDSLGHPQIVSVELDPNFRTFVLRLKARFWRRWDTREQNPTQKFFQPDSKPRLPWRRKGAEKNGRNLFGGP